MATFADGSHPVRAARWTGGPHPLVTHGSPRSARLVLKSVFKIRVFAHPKSKSNGFSDINVWKMILLPVSFTAF